MKMADLFTRALKKSGIDICFGVIGGEAEAINFSDKPDCPRFILTRHEFTAGIATEVWGRLSKRPAVCWTTFAPGLTNAATGMCSAILDRSPALFASAQIPRTEAQFNLTHQCIDNVTFARPLTKGATEITTAESLQADLRRLITLCQEDLPGPVYTSLPLDVLKSDVPEDQAEAILSNLCPPPLQTRPSPDPDTIQAIASVIAASRYPMVVVGNQIIRDDKIAEVMTLIEHLKAPVICSLAAKGVVPDTHALFLGAVNKYLDGVYNQPIIEPMFAEIDLMILVGYDYGEDLKPSLWGSNKRTVLINSVDVPMGTTFQPDLACIGNLSVTIDHLLHTTRPLSGLSPKHATLKTIIDKRRTYNLPRGITDVALVIESLSNALGENGFLCTDVGLHKQYAGLLARTHKPNRFLCSNVCGSFGFGLPAAIATQLQFPRSRVALICGDGGFHSGSQDLETLVRYDLPIVIVLLNDRSFGLIRYYETLSGRGHCANMTEFENVDFALLANANGVASERLDSEVDIALALDRAFEAQKPFLIEIPTTYSYEMRRHIA